MVSAACSAKRSALAKKTRLGRKGIEATAAAPAALASHGALADPAPASAVKADAPANDAEKKPRKRAAKAA